MGLILCREGIKPFPHCFHVWDELICLFVVFHDRRGKAVTLYMITGEIHQDPCFLSTRSFLQLALGYGSSGQLNLATLFNFLLSQMLNQ
jgi:hypothetical protein